MKIMDQPPNPKEARQFSTLPFSGSGSTLIACERTGRSCRTIELDSKFVDVTIKRWQVYTGRDAILADNGKTFAETQEENS